jgi:hypothetical protein
LDPPRDILPHDYERDTLQERHKGATKYRFESNDKRPRLLEDEHHRHDRQAGSEKKDDTPKCDASAEGAPSRKATASTPT